MAKRMSFGFHFGQTIMKKGTQKPGRKKEAKKLCTPGKSVVLRNARCSWGGKKGGVSTDKSSRSSDALRRAGFRTNWRSEIWRSTESELGNLEIDLEIGRNSNYWRSEIWRSTKSEIWRSTELEIGDLEDDDFGVLRHLTRRDPPSVGRRIQALCAFRRAG